MMLRYPTFTTILGMLLALGLGTSPTVAVASTTSGGTSTQTVQWTSLPLVASTDLPPADPTSTVPQVVINVSPAGAIIPPTLSDGSLGSPLTVPANSTGFDPSQLVVALLNTKDASGNPEQELGLDFFGSGLKAGTSIPLTLSIDSSLVSNPPQLSVLTPGFAFAPDSSSSSSSATPAISTGESSRSSETNSAAQTIPEPLSLFLWSVIVVGVAARKRFSPRFKAA